MGNILYDLVEPAELVNYVREWDLEVRRPNSRWTLDRWFPSTQVDDLEFRIRKGALNDVDVAEYRAWDTPPPMTARPGVSRIEGSLGPVSRQIPLGEEEYLRARSLQAGSNDPVVTEIYNDAERMIRSVQGRIELARGDLIDDGAVTISENGLTLSADFDRDATMSVSAAIPWTTTATATPLADLLGWLQAYSDMNGVEPQLMLMARARLANLALNAEMRAYAASNGTTPTRLNAGSINDIFASEGLPPIEIYDSQVRLNGVATRILPVDKVFFMPSAGEPMGTTFYGTTAEALLLAGKGLLEASEAPGIVAVVILNENPVQTFTVGTAIALPAMPNPNLVMDMDVA